MSPFFRWVFDYSSRLRQIDVRLSGIAFIAAAAVFALVLSTTSGFADGIGFPTHRFPVAASAAVAKLAPDARILAPDYYGGYLIYRFEGQRHVYVDGRSDFYGAEFMKQYLILMNARAGWKDVVRTFGFTHALLPRNSALLPALIQAGWVSLYKDHVAMLLEAR